MSDFLLTGHTWLPSITTTLPHPHLINILILAKEDGPREAERVSSRAKRQESLHIDI